MEYHKPMLGGILDECEVFQRLLMGSSVHCTE